MIINQEFVSLHDYIFRMDSNFVWNHPFSLGQ